MAKTGDDCFYFYAQTCIKGAACPFRHVEEAKSSSVTCDNWRMNRCMAQPCTLRHMELQQNTPCFYETQPGGCTKPDCKFRHNFPKHTAVPPLPPVTTVQASQPGIKVAQPPPGQVPVMWNRPWHGPNVLPTPHAFPGAPLPGPQRLGAPGFPVFGPGGPGNIPMMKIEPVVINPNEESDQDSIKESPMKQPQRSVVTATTSAPSSVQSSNPLDYFLNAKPWIDPNQRKVCSRDPSPRRASPYHRQGSVSPSRSQSPHRSISPEAEVRRRSVSAERYNSGSRRRSNSLDRSRSPEWRDRRRFGRRSSRSPQRRRSRSPGGSRGVGILGRFRTGTRGTKLEEVKVTGSKVISIKKDKKEKEDQDGEKEKQDDKSEDKVRVKAEQSKAAPVIKEEVKSLEDIYRERALQSLMEAKRKKILENKRKRWEKVDASKKSESDKSEKEVDEETRATVDEKGDNQDKVDSSSDSPDDEDGNKSEDLPDDIDIELGEGELESDKEESVKSEEESDKELKSDTHESEEESEKASKRTKSSITVPDKPSIKSRLGLKTASKAPQLHVTGRDRIERTAIKRSVKDRLGFKPSQGSENPLRTGVIKLSRHSRSDNVLSRIGIKHEIRDRKREGKSILMLPQITVKNEVDIEDRKAGLKQRLGLLDDEANDSDSKKDRKRKRGIDEELMKLLREEEAEIDEEDLELLSKKEKKKLLKKLLVQQGREEEYEAIRKKKKRGFKKKKDRIDEEGDRSSRRRINVQERLGRKKEAEEVVEDVDVENLPSEDEIELEEVTEELSETSPEKEEAGGSADKEAEETRREISVKSLEEMRRTKEEKDARLREAMEPKSLEDIRRERALKKSVPGEGGMIIAAGHNRRKIVLEEEELPKDIDPPVRVTFSGRDFPEKRKLIRLGKNQEQNENDQPSETKSARIARRERQIYVPPTVKRTEAPVVLSRSAGPPKGREIIDYGDMFPRKSTSADDVEKKKIKLVSSASESDLNTRPRLTLQKGPPKVEVKDATVKTFAEIMAEKKRKRLLAQQGKPYTPVVFSEPECSSSAQSSKSVSMEDRLSPVSTEPQVTSISSVHMVSSPVKTHTLTKSASSTSVQAESKPTRWKRRKINNPEVLISDDSNLSQESVSIKGSQVSGDSNRKSTEKFEKVQEPETSQKPSPSAVKKQISVDESKTKAEKKKKMSDSFMDLEDDILNFEDNDIDLELEAGHQDADELMREIDELLS